MCEGAAFPNQNAEEALWSPEKPSPISSLGYLNHRSQEARGDPAEGRSLGSFKTCGDMVCKVLTWGALLPIKCHVRPIKTKA